MNSIVEGYTHGKTVRENQGIRKRKPECSSQGVESGRSGSCAELLDGKFPGVHFITVLHQLLT